MLATSSRSVQRILGGGGCKTRLGRRSGSTGWSQRANARSRGLCRDRPGLAGRVGHRHGRMRRGVTRGSRPRALDGARRRNRELGQPPPPHRGRRPRQGGGQLVSPSESWTRRGGMFSPRCSRANLFSKRCEGRRRTAEVSTPLGGGAAGHRAMSASNSRRVRDRPAMNADTDPAVCALLGLQSVSQSRFDERVVLHRIPEASRKATGARYAALGILNERATGSKAFSRRASTTRPGTSSDATRGAADCSGSWSSGLSRCGWATWAHTRSATGFPLRIP